MELKTLELNAKKIAIIEKSCNKTLHDLSGDTSMEMIANFIWQGHDLANLDEAYSFIDDYIKDGGSAFDLYIKIFARLAELNFLSPALKATLGERERILLGIQK